MTDHDDRQDADDHLDEEELQATAPETDEADSSETDWGLSPPKSGMGKEIKIGLSILTLVFCLFGYVVWQKMSEDGALAEDVQGHAKATAPSEPAPGDGSEAVTPPPDETTPRVKIVGVGGGKLGNGSLEDPDEPFQEPDYQNPNEEDLISRTEDPGFNTKGLKSDTQGQTFEDSDVAGDELAQDAFAEDSFSDEENPYANDENDPQTNTDIGAASGDEVFAEPTEATFDDSQDGQTASSLPDESTEAAQAFDEFDPIDGDDAQAEVSDSPGEDFQTLADDVGEEVNRGDQNFADDSLTARTYRGNLLPNQASSQTIVRRVQEPEETEASTIDPRSDGGRSRSGGYRTADQYKEPADDQFRNESSLGAERDALNGGKDLAKDSLADSRETQYQQRGSRDVESENPRGFDSSPDVADDHTFDFNEPQHKETAADILDQGEFPQQHSGNRYVIEANDSFWSIARQTYGSPKFFQALAKHNQQTIADPRAMRPGIEIETPSSAELQRLYPELLGGVKQASQRTPLTDDDFRPGDFESRDRFDSGRFQAAKTPEAEIPGFFRGADRQPQYRVASKDTLGAIARKYLGRSSRWEEIHRLNRDRLADPNRLKIGTVLRLPADATAPRIVETPYRSR